MVRPAGGRPWRPCPGPTTAGRLTDSDTGDGLQGVVRVYRSDTGELFDEANHVSVHAPKLPETEKMIGRDQLR